MDVSADDHRRFANLKCKRLVYDAFPFDLWYTENFGISVKLIQLVHIALSRLCLLADAWIKFYCTNWPQANQ